MYNSIFPLFSTNTPKYSLIFPNINNTKFPNSTFLQLKNSSPPPSPNSDLKNDLHRNAFIHPFTNLFKPTINKFIEFSSIQNKQIK